MGAGAGAAEWITGDESAKEMLARVLTARPFLLLPPLHRLPLRVGNVVEIVGSSPSAKTEILIQAAVSCILPNERNGVHYGGLDRLVIFLDLDCSFDILRLGRLLKHRIMEANRVNNAIYDEANEAGYLSYDAREEADNEALFTMCLKRFLYTRCYDSFEFLSTLKTLHYQCQKEGEAQKISAYFLMVDSIGAFHWVDRGSTSLSRGSATRKGFSLQSVCEAVVEEIQKLVLVHPMLVLTTKATILGDRCPLNGVNRSLNSWPAHETSDSVFAASKSERSPYREYMPSAWQSFVTHRILVRPLVAENNFTDRNIQDGSVYTSEWLLPPLSILDKFIVLNVGVYVVS